MKRVCWLAMVVLGGVLVVGCPGKDGGKTNSDGGFEDEVDAGTSDPIDAGNMSMVDAGTPDAGTNGKISVSGTVYTNDGQKIAGATVLIVGKGSTTSGSDGTFSFTDVQPPYDLASISSGSGKTHATIYKGVSRADPRVVILSLGATNKIYGTLDFEVTGTQAHELNAAGQRTHLWFDSVELKNQVADVAGTTSADGSAPAGYRDTFQMYWLNLPAVTGSVHILQWQSDTNLPASTSYSGYGRLDNVAMVSDGTVTKQVNLGAVVSTVFSGTLVTPTGYTPTAKRVYLTAPHGTSLRLFTETGAAKDFSYAVPQLGAFTYEIACWAEEGDRSMLAVRRGLPANPSGLTVNMNSPAPSLSLPVDAAVGIDLATQSFSWSPFTGGLHVANLYGTNVTLSVITSDSKATLPSTSELGLGTFPTGTEFQWRTTGFTGSSSVDDVLSGSRTVSDALSGPGDYAFAYSELRTFKTK